MFGNQLSLGVTMLGGRPVNGRPLRAHGGLYRIENTVTGDFYVGSATWFARRVRQHRSNLECGLHPNRHLQASWDKYGAEAFVMTALVVLEPEALLVAEQRLLDAVFGTPGCMNQQRYVEATRRGMKQPAAAVEKSRQANIGRKASDRTRARMSVAHRNRPPMTGTYKGVSFDPQRGRYVAQLTIAKKRVLMQRFDTEAEAALAYNATASAVWGGDCYLNKVS